MKVSALVKIGPKKGYMGIVRFKHMIRKAGPFKTELAACEWAAIHALRMEAELMKSASRILRDRPKTKGK